MKKTLRIIGLVTLVIVILSGLNNGSLCNFEIGAAVFAVAMIVL
jgi:uncharacterized membrane protein YuzA (DUF378 family)